MTEYKFPYGLSEEERSALIWKTEDDYRNSNMVSGASKDTYVLFAVNFYTRNRYSLEDVVLQYRAHLRAEWKRTMARAFMADMQVKASKQAVSFA